MKIDIGPYIDYWSTANFEKWWITMRTGKRIYDVKDEDYTDFDHFVEKLCDIWQSVLNATINKIQARRKRKIKIRIDPHDTWGMQSTLALIIVPMLIQLKNTKHGSPFVDDCDVPIEIRSTSAIPDDDNLLGSADEYFFDRWDWIVCEMIYAFQEISKDDWPSVKLSQSEYAKIQNGLRLFGKYYDSLWD